MKIFLSQATDQLLSNGRNVPSREQAYSGRGTDTIKRCNDGRLVGESISWGEYGLRGNVEIQ